MGGGERGRRRRVRLCRQEIGSAAVESRANNNINNINTTIIEALLKRNASSTELLAHLPTYSIYPLASCPSIDDVAKKDYYVYNPLAQKDRYACGNLKIPAQQSVKIHSLSSLSLWKTTVHDVQACLYAARWYPVIPGPAVASDLPPTTLLDNSRMGGGRGEPFADCDVPCYHSGTSSILTKRYIADTPFHFICSMEGEVYYPQLAVNHKAWRNHKFFATTAFHSDVPLPYFSFAEYDIQHGHDPVSYDTAIHGAVFLARNCAARNDRDAWVVALQNYSSSIFRIDSLSKCHHNAELPPGLVSLEDKTAVMRQYLFYLAFENQNTVDYITEKLWGAFVAGVVPVYMGAPNIKEHVPEHSVIFVKDYDSPRALAEYLRHVASDRDLYEAYHAWRKQPLPPHFLQKYNITRTHSVCRTCRWAFARRYGLGWSHEQQSIQELMLPRHACFANDGNADNNRLLSWPVVERWYTRRDDGNHINDDDDDNDNGITRVRPLRCPASRHEPWQDKVTIAQHWERTLYEHDGVIDLYVQPSAVVPASSTEAAVLELVVPFEETDPGLRYRQVGPGHLEWQNQTSRVTILVKPVDRTPRRRASSSSTVVQLWHPQAVRIMVEDIDRFHVGAADAENYFGSTMKQDWEAPLEVFVIEEDDDDTEQT